MLTQYGLTVRVKIEMASINYNLITSSNSKIVAETWLLWSMVSIGATVAKYHPTVKWISEKTNHALNKITKHKLMVSI